MAHVFTNKTADLGQGWFANANDDGGFTIRNPDKGQRIDLTAVEAAGFVELWNRAKAEVEFKAKEAENPEPAPKAIWITAQGVPAEAAKKAYNQLYRRGILSKVTKDGVTSISVLKPDAFTPEACLARLRQHLGHDLNDLKWGFKHTKFFIDGVEVFPWGLPPS